MKALPLAGRLALLLTSRIFLTAEVKLPPHFSDHMVLQRELPVPIWGAADPGEHVVVEFAGQKKSAKADAQGRWRVDLAPLETSATGRTLTVTGDRERRHDFHDVLVGEVWLCSGQSNMDFTLARTEKYYFAGVTNETEEVAAANYPAIRMFTGEWVRSYEPRAEVAGRWKLCTPENAREFSAVGYYFARELLKEINVPVGIVTLTYGASTAQAWIRREAIAADPELKPLLEKFDREVVAYRANPPDMTAALTKWEEDVAKAKAAGTKPPRKPGDKNPTQDQHNPTVMFNGMVAPFVPYAMRGVLWYQGESITGPRELFPKFNATLIKDWRELWGRELPFFFVQLAGHKAPAQEPGNSSIATVRELQAQALSLPATGMAVSFDLGDEKDVHPKNKQDVGARLTRIALAKVYGRPVEYSGPVYESMVVEGSAIRLNFSHAESGLEAKGGESLKHFAIAGADGKFAWAEAKIDGSSVIVSSPQITSPTAVRYAWADNPDVANLANGAGLPAVPFRTDAPLPHHAWAPKPPMGWNSWDSFATTVTEAQTKANADMMAAKLKQYGWEYVVVDIQWYEPNATSFDYRKDATLVMDEWGRLQPALNRFPSAAGGKGFKALADYVHGLGLKFGLHLMRGIPRQAVEKNLPIKDSPHRAADIANKASICAWNPDMYGVDMTKPGAQAYYDSVFALIASWGVDFVKVDDLSRPYHDNEKEIEGIRRAIDRTGRPMVLSMSPGETALSAAEHARRHANLWRISDDFWDTWPALLEQFTRLENWNPYRGAGYWPDADMLPLGVLEMGKRTTRFTREEQFTLMTLWSIARSPLMHGGDMAKMDDFTLSLLTNDEILAVNQTSANNRPLFSRDGFVAWTADVPGSPDKYLAVFNTRDRIPLTPQRASFRSNVITRETPGLGVSIDLDIKGATTLVLVADEAGDGKSWDHALWVEPRVVMSDGSERSLVAQTWTRAEAGHDEVSREKSPSGAPMSVAGKLVTGSLGAHAPSLIEYPLPAGAVRFKAFGALDDAAMKQPKGGTLRFLVFAVQPGGDSEKTVLPVAVSLKELGFAGKVCVRDLWRRADLGETEGEFAPAIPWHGAGLYRVSPVSR